MQSGKAVLAVRYGVLLPELLVPLEHHRCRCSQEHGAEASSAGIAPGCWARTWGGCVSGKCV